jgi:hypothetical protein
MWKIELASRNDSLETISFYSSFTALNKVLTFSLAPEDNSYKPIEISFVTKKDKSQKDFSIQAGDFIDNKMTITYFNPGIGLSGLKEPMIILENDTNFFKVMFNTNLLKESDSYLLTIEFFIQNK